MSADDVLFAVEPEPGYGGTIMVTPGALLYFGNRCVNAARGVFSKAETTDFVCLS
jgi:hypothetical protein